MGATAGGLLSTAATTPSALIPATATSSSSGTPARWSRSGSGSSCSTEGDQRQSSRFCDLARCFRDRSVSPALDSCRPLIEEFGRSAAMQLNVLFCAALCHTALYPFLSSDLIQGCLDPRHRSHGSG